MEEIKLRAGDYLIPAKMWPEGKRLFFQFPYNKILISEIKAMEGHKYHGFDPKPKKIWSIADSPRNRFQLEYLFNKNPYSRYDQELLIPNVTYRDNRLLFAHQPEGLAHCVQRKQCILAWEMGTCKTLVAIMAMETASNKFLEKYNEKMIWWYIAPRSALRAVEREFKIWKSTVVPEFLTYEGMVKRIKTWNNDRDQAPAGIVFDESSKLKTPNTQRTIAARALATEIRDQWLEDANIYLLTGTPAPKSPADWWSQAEIACPGFLKEGDIGKFKRSLAVIVQKQDISGGIYPQLVTWRDSESKCNVCGELKDSPNHEIALASVGYHDFVPGKNEVARLYKRLQGLVSIKFKKDCLDLPDKHYKIIELKPTPEIQRAAKMILKTATSTIQGLTLLRELSDGFQYINETIGIEPCPRCNGEKQINEMVPDHESCPNCDGQNWELCLQLNQHRTRFREQLVSCSTCGGKGSVKKQSRATKEIACPKDQAILDLLDEHEDIGRIVIYAGFTGSIDRIVKLCLKSEWMVIRIDQGKESIYNNKGILIKDNYLDLFQEKKLEYPRIAFVAHPGSAGMGLTLTASPTIVYFSNDFNAESRIQSEDRIHRPGMDLSRGATIIDLVHLSSDIKVLENLKKKRDLQAISLGEFNGN